MKHLSGTAWIRGFLRRVPLSQAGPEVLTLKSPTPGHLNSQVEGSPVLAIPLGIWQWLGFAHSGSPPNQLMASLCCPHQLLLVLTWS